MRQVAGVACIIGGSRVVRGARKQAARRRRPARLRGDDRPFRRPSSGSISSRTEMSKDSVSSPPARGSRPADRPGSRAIDVPGSSRPSGVRARHPSAGPSSRRCRSRTCAPSPARRAPAARSRARRSRSPPSRPGSTQVTSTTGGSSSSSTASGRHHVREPRVLGRMYASDRGGRRRVERHVGRARLLDRRGRHQHLDRALQAQAHQRVRLHAARDQVRAPGGSRAGRARDSSAARPALPSDARATPGPARRRLRRAVGLLPRSCSVHRHAPDTRRAHVVVPLNPTDQGARARPRRRIGVRDESHDPDRSAHLRSGSLT